MVARDAVEEEAAHPSHEVPIDCSSSTALEGPLFAAVARHFRVGVVQEGDHENCFPDVGNEGGEGNKKYEHQCVTQSQGMI